MGRPAKVSVDDAVKVIKDYMKFFQTDTFPEYSAQTWKDMSKALNGEWNAHNVYINVRENRRNILTIAREEMGIVVKKEGCEPLHGQALDQLNLLDDSGQKSQSVDESSFFADTTNENIILGKEPEKLDSASDENGNINTQIFKLDLSQEDWDAIKPEEPIVFGGREKYVLKPWVWTNIVNIAFWRQHKLSCAFLYKRADVTICADGLSYEIKIVGKCKSTACGNIFIGRATKRRDELGGLTIDVETRDTRDEVHEETKRPFNGKRRKEAAEELIAEGCSGWKKRKARENMNMYDLEPAFLPSLDVLRQARKEACDRQLDVRPGDTRDLIRTIEELSSTVEYAGLIQAVSSLPFSVFYGAPPQLHAYNEYCRIAKGASRIMLDSTGSLIMKLIRPDNKKTGHIFLYCVVINFEKTTLPVYQMLSEKHDTEFIQYWLQQWIRSGARKPNEAVCDYSRALISGICMAMNNITIKMYINECFARYSMQGIPRSFVNISTYIRIDVAHLIHMVCRWKCFSLVRQSAIKDFFVRCVALMIECQTLPQFTEIFILTYVVGSQEHEDTIIEFPQAESTRQARKKLEGYIAVRGINNFNEFEERGSDVNDDQSVDPEETSSTGSPIEQWVQDQVTRAQRTIHEGSELNPFYLPDFILQLSRLVKEFPLWTSVTLPYEAPHATSSCIEGYFNDLKTRVLRNTTRPLRVDKFLKKHAMDISGGTLLFSSKLMNFEKRGDSVPVLPLKNTVETNHIVEEPVLNDSDLMSQENWRGKAIAQNIEDFEESIEVEIGSSEHKINIEDLAVGSNVSVQGMKEIASSPTADDHCNNAMEDELDWSQNQIERTLGPLPTCLEMLHKEQIEKVLDYSDGKIGQLNSTQNSAESSMMTIEENVNNNFRPEVQDTDGDLKKVQIEKVLLDHSYGKTSELDSTQNPTEDVITTPLLEENVNENCRSGTQEKETVPIDITQINTATEVVLPEKTKESKYFKACPEIRQMNLLNRKSKKPSLLPNGSICRRPAKIDGMAYFVEFTCPFDSLVSIIMTGTIDNIHYASFVDRSENRTLQFVSELTKKGLTAALRTERTSILKTFYQAIPTTVTNKRIVAYTISAWDSIANIAKKSLDTTPSLFETHNCPLCSRRQLSVPVMGVNERVITKEGFGMLGKALSFRSRTYSNRCYKPCDGRYTLEKTLNVHLLIELDVRSTGEGMPLAKQGMPCKLRQLPVNISLGEEQKFEYTLIGVVGFRAKHFTGYCRRKNGIWQKYDDFAREVSNSNPNDDIEPHLAIYIRDYGDHCDAKECPCNSETSGIPRLKLKVKCT